MSEEEINRILDHFYNNYLSHSLNDIARQVERLKESMEREQNELKLRVAEAETKLRLYEAVFNKLNLNIDINAGGKE